MVPRPSPPHGRNWTAAMEDGAQKWEQRPEPASSSLAANAAKMQQKLNEALASFVNAHQDTGRATMLLLLASAPGGRVRFFATPLDTADLDQAVEADEAGRNAVAIRFAIQLIAKTTMADKRRSYNELTVAIGLAPRGGPPFFCLGDVARKRGGNGLAGVSGPCWPPDLRAAVDAVADRLNEFVDANLPPLAARGGRRGRVRKGDRRCPRGGGRGSARC